MPSTNLRAGASEHNYSAAWLLYMAGDTLEGVGEKLSIPYSTLAAFAVRHKWRDTRNEALQVARRAIKEDLTQRMEKHKSKHQHFILDTLDKTQEKLEEMAGNIDGEEVTVGGVLNLTRQHDDIARRTLRLDEDKANNPVEFGYAVLRMLRGGQNTSSAMDVLPDQSSANTGILRPFNALENGMVADEKEAIEAEYEMTGPIKPLKEMPATLQFKTPTRNDTPTADSR